jgi:hypothetical protein
LNRASFTLESGQALHCLGDLEQQFGTGGGGVAVVIAWKSLKANPVGLQDKAS